MNLTKFKRIFLIALCAVALLGCEQDKSPTPTLPVDSQSFDATIKSVGGSTVRFYGWGGSETINRWIEGPASKALKSSYQIDLIRVSSEAPAALAKLRAEKSGGKTQGSIDLLWINGENFKIAQEEGLLWGPITPSVPNFIAYVNPDLGAWDFGTPTHGMESPWGQAQFVLEYDSAHTQPPATARELLTWIKAHPGRFTYPEPPEFTGSAFIRQLFLQLNGGPAPFLKGFDEDLYNRSSANLWAWLKEASPYLWKAGKSYPRSSADLDLLFERGEVDWSMNYTPSRAQGKIQEGKYPSTVRTWVLEEGSLSNVHFVAIPFNAPNKAGALALANILLSPDLQLDKNRPNQWGDFSVLDPRMLSESDQKRFASLDLGPATLPVATLNAHALSEIPAPYVERLERDWLLQVARPR